MKTMFRNLIAGSLVAAVLALALLTGSNAVADEKDVSKTLQERVAKLSPEQQAALLAFLDQLPSGKTATAVETPEAAMREALRQFENAGANKTFNLDPFMERVSKDFQISALGGKNDLRQWLDSMSSILFPNGVPAVKFSLNNAKFKVNGDTAEVYPVEVSAPIGTAYLTVRGKLEDGVWRVIGVDGV